VFFDPIDEAKALVLRAGPYRRDEIAEAKKRVVRSAAVPQLW
jgi:hypothetical protein